MRIRISRLCASVVAVVLAAAVAGCSDDPPAEPSTRGSAETGSTASDAPEGTGRPTPSSEPTQPTSDLSATPYRVHPAEADRGVKRVAARAVEGLAKVRQVTYTQYFGYAPPAASILVEADFEPGGGGGGATYDVRLTQRDGDWSVDSITPAGEVPRADDLSQAARRVLRSDRIDLNWAGRADIRGGLVDDRVLTSMLTVAREHRIGISVLIGAHPVNVFGTDRRSNHPDGTAYDIGHIDGRLVVEPDARALVREVMQAAAATGAYQVGGPEDLDGGGGQYFSDVTHSEHIHVGFGG